MAADDPLPGSSWIGAGHYAGEKIPKVKPKKKVIGIRVNPMRPTPTSIQRNIARIQNPGAGPEDAELRKLSKQARDKRIHANQNWQKS